MDMNIQEIMIANGEKIEILKIVIATIFWKAVVWILIETGGITGALESMGYTLLMNLPIIKEFLAGMKVVQDANDQKTSCKDIWKERTCKRIKKLGKCWKKKFAI